MTTILSCVLPANLCWARKNIFGPIFDEKKSDRTIQQPSSISNDKINPITVNNVYMF